LVAPSITEGFGLPVAEAMLAGCRVVCSEIPAHWEIGAGRCHFVELGQQAEERLAAAIAASLSEAKPMPDRLPELSAPVLARDYVALYRKVITSDAVIRGSAALSVAVSERQLL
jgi:glycosyltransferase involved in cell wall biosynthesis